MKDEIKSCPFCNSEPALIQGFSRGASLYKITCTNPNCDALVHLNDSDRERLIERWNRRDGYVSKPTWKRQPPSTVGYWWYREDRDTKPEIVELRCNPENMDWYAVSAFTGETRRVGNLTGEWAKIYFPNNETNYMSGDSSYGYRKSRISLAPQLGS